MAYNYDEQHPRPQNRFDDQAAWAWTLTTDRRSACGRGSKFFQRPDGAIVRFPMFCHSWQCERCSMWKRRERQFAIKQRDPILANNFFLSQDSLLENDLARRAILRRVRDEGGGYVLICREDLPHFVIVADTDFSKGRKYNNLLTGKKRRYRLRDVLLDKALRLPYLRRVEFGGTWSAKNFMPEEDDEQATEKTTDDSVKFLALSYHIDEATYVEIIEEIGGKVSDWIGWDGAISRPEGMSADEFAKAFRQALDERGFHDEQVSE